MFTFSLPFFFMLFYTITTTTQPYKPNVVIFINCGSESTVNQGWVGDEKLRRFVPSNISTTSFSSTLAHQGLESSVPLVPYSTARFFNSSSFTYTFRVPSGPKFLRLHFYPANYSDINIEQSFFSVSSNGYSLLTNFSAFLTLSFLQKTRRAQAPCFVKEFLIYVNDEQPLNVMFTPSPNSYAFINGIEIISMPLHLYFVANSLKYVGIVNGPVVDNNTALENIYRLNMGGKQIHVYNDTGMYRSWDQDGEYIHGEADVLTQLYHSPIMYNKVTPKYTAPELLYQTQRSIGDKAGKYSLTWILPVDSGFYYMLRLHFCNIITHYKKPSQAHFTIFINNQTAEEEVDLFSWTNGSGYPVFKDYLIYVEDPNLSRSKQDLWVAMHPKFWYELYGDAYLNGLEVFKLSMNRSLASPNPELSIKSAKGNKEKTPWVVIIGVEHGLVLFIVLVIVVVCRGRRVIHFGVAADRLSSKCHRFSLKELKAATNEFNDSFVIGNGGFGKVYKGYMNKTPTIVAIKRLDSSSRQGFQEFCTEIEMLSKLRHVNLVSLIGYCDDEGEMILVYDYMAHGTLREHLYNTKNPPLSWKARLDICIGVAKGLQYLHSGGPRAIIHGDVKSTNILLDDDWVAKLSDFGLSKLGHEDQLETHVDTVVKGSLGYVDPEYCWTQQLTKKSDVYSFGVVLLEVLCARPVIDVGLRDEQVSLVEWGKICSQKGTLQEIIDPNLSGEIAPESLRKFEHVASKCLHEEGSARPAMEEVVWRLEFSLQLQEDDEKTSNTDRIKKN